MRSLYGFRNDGEMVINLTTKCNQSCLNCPSDESFIKQDITKKGLFDFIKNNYGSDINVITLIGGEPTISPHFFKVLKLFSKLKKKINVQINSNGVMFSYDSFSKKMYELKKRGLEFNIEFGIYSPDKKVHEKITQLKGSWDKSVNGLKRLLNYDISCGIRTVSSKMNYNSFKNYGDFINKNKLHKVSSFTFIGMDVIGSAYENKDKLLISHLDLAPKIEEGIDSLRKVLPDGKIEVHLLPKAIFNKKYRKFVIKSGCVDGAFTDNGELCKECVYYNDCPRLMNSYVKFFGKNEHKPVLD
ncbi:MAG: radical SAM protein [Candidatus Woesearchaeota archaeon]